MQNKTEDTTTGQIKSSQELVGSTSASRFAPVEKEDYSEATMALYEREVARGVEEGEEIFTGEETISDSKPNWAGKYKPRKPRYFNRVQMGFEWNKYNQTHYDTDNPPPKVVQGYKVSAGSIVSFREGAHYSSSSTYSIRTSSTRAKRQLTRSSRSRAMRRRCC